jgi:rhodanese-related sulfurtransferase
MEQITAGKLKANIDAGQPQTLLDVREPWEYKICRIAGSVNIPMSEIVGRYQELDHEKDIVVICHHGNRSYNVACYLETAGFGKKIMNLEGGVDAWAEYIDESMPKY